LGKKAILIGIVVLFAVVLIVAVSSQSRPESTLPIPQTSIPEEPNDDVGAGTAEVMRFEGGGIDVFD
jgi:hypothetical protein